MPGQPGPVSDDHHDVSWLEAAVPGLILAAVTPDNTPHGYNLTFAFPMLLFIIIGVILYLLFSRPHRRVPARTISYSAGRSGATGSGAAPGAAATATAPTATSAPAATAAAEAPAAETGSAAEPEADKPGADESDKGTEDTE
jgi:hypothetical protein